MNTIESIINISIETITFICFYIAIQTILIVLLIRSKEKNKYFLLGLNLLSFFALNYGIWKEEQSIYLLVFSTIPILSLVLILDNIFGEKEKNVESIFDVRFPGRPKSIAIKNIRRGVSIIGAAGSGKTDSPIYYLMHHFSKNAFPGVLYDYKDFELTEIAAPLYGNRLKVICFHKPELSYRVNPIEPTLLKDETDVIEVCSVILENLLGGSSDQGSGKFFEGAANSLLTGVIWTFKESFPQYCTLPHVIAFILTVDHSLQEGRFESPYGKLGILLRSTPKGQILSSTFLSGMVSPKQTAGVMATLSEALKKIATNTAFWVLSENQLDLAINKKEVNNVLSLVNYPAQEAVYSPLLATIAHTTLKQMQKRDREPSFLLLDEAPTIKLQNIGRIPATMRSFGVSTIYTMQDQVQGAVQYGELKIREILANLSTQVFGKANDPKSAKYFEDFFQYIEKKDFSKSYSDLTKLQTDNRYSVRIKEEKKYRASDFMQLKVGEFIVFSDGQDEKLKFTYPKIERKMPEKLFTITEQDLKENFDHIIEEVQNIYHRLP